MATIQKKVNTNDLPNMIGQTIVIRNNADNSERRGVILSVAADGKSVLVKENKLFFYVNTAYDPTKYVFADNPI